MDFLQNPPQAVLEFPFRIMVLEFSHVADPPNMIANAIVLNVSPIQFLSADPFAKLHGFEHGTI